MRTSARTSDHRIEPPQRVVEDETLDTLPNDLTRMLYLASLRDCNTGRYLHSEMSARFGVEAVDSMLGARHDRIFRRLLSTPASGYVAQLTEYIGYARAEKLALINTWQSLRVYRATVPLLASPIYCDLFCLRVEMALVILACPQRQQETA